MIRAALAYCFYRWFAFPFAHALVHLAFPFLPPKMRAMVEERRGRKLTPLLSSPIWIHAASGEIEYAKPVIRALKNRYPELPILVTYFSPSAKKLIQNFPGVDLAIAAPWDSVAATREFLDFYKPRAGLFARTDVWPTAATEARARGTPLLLFAATLSSDSSRLKAGRAALSRWVFAQLSGIFCVSLEDAAQFRRISPRLRTLVAGDTRYDQVVARLEAASNLPAGLAPETGDFVFIAGSTWPEDEEVILPALAPLMRQGVRPILVPHEVGPDHLQKIEARLRESGFESLRFSTASRWTGGSVLLMDQVGRLADLYRWGNVAFVGGSFKDKVHSVMEPLAAGLPVLVGPKHLNNREALQFQAVRLKAGETAVRQVDNAADLESRVLFWKQAPSCGEELAEIVKARTGASKQVVHWVDEVLRLEETV